MGTLCLLQVHPEHMLQMCNGMENVLLPVTSFSMMFWGGTTMKVHRCTDLCRLLNGTLTSIRYRLYSLDPLSDPMLVESVLGSSW